MSFRKIELTDTTTADAKATAAQYKSEYLADHDRRIFITVHNRKGKHILYFFDKTTFYKTKDPDVPRKTRSDKGRTHTIVKTRSDKGKHRKTPTPDHTTALDDITTLLQSQGVDDVPNMRMGDVRQLLIR